MHKQEWPDLSSLDPVAVNELVQAYRLVGDPDRAEELDGTLCFALTIQKLEGRAAATSWLRRQAKLVRDENHR